MASCTVAYTSPLVEYDYKRRERIDKWVSARGHLHDYSLAQLKRDVAAELAYQEESAELASYPDTRW